MKKFLSLLLTVALVATSIVIPVTAATAGSAPAGAYLDVESGEYVADPGIVNTVVADYNFNDAVMDFTNFQTDDGTGAITTSVASNTYVPILTTNSATTDKTITIQTKANYAQTNADTTLTSSQQGYFYRPYTVSEGDLALAPADRKRQSKFQILISDGVAPAVESDIVYVDFKIKRLAGASGTNNAEDNVTIKLLDTSAKEIATLFYGNYCYPKLEGTVGYGGESTSGESVTNYANDLSWQCIRFAMNFNLHTFEMYVGNTWDELKPMVSSVESYTMKSTSAANFAELYIGDKGSLAIDDFAVYTVTPPVAPAASDIAVTGKPNLGETLTMTYGTYSCEGDIAEGDSYCYWEASADASFVSSVKLTDNIPVKAGETNDYVITETATGKYVRCVVVPVNAAGIDGTKVYSNATSYKVNDITVTLSVSGNIKGGTNWDYKSNPNNYAGKVSFVSTLSASKAYTLIAAWYVSETDAETGVKMQRLVSVKALPVTVDAANATESGAINTSFTTDTVYSVPKYGDGNENTIKVMLVDSLSTMNPACNYVYAGTNF